MMSEAKKEIQTETEESMEASDEVVSAKEETKETSITMDKIEDIARQQGWSPEKGDLDALEFLGKGREFRDRIFKKLEKVEQDSKRAYEIIADHISSQKKKEHVQEQRTIEEQIRAATEEGDADRVLALSKKLKEPEPTPSAPDNKKEYVDNWTKERTWFYEKPDMRDDAIAFYQTELVKRGVDDPEVILPLVEARIKRVYPTYFNPENPNKNLSSGAEKAGKQKSGKAGLSLDDLTESERRHLEDFVKMGMDEKRLLRSIENARKRI